MATFSGLTLDKAGAGDTLRASGAGLSSRDDRVRITVTAAAATQLVVTTPAARQCHRRQRVRPRRRGRGSPSGTSTPNFTGSVTLALATNPDGATLGGTCTVNASAGVATFSGLTLDKAGAGDTLAGVRRRPELPRRPAPSP